MNMLILSCAEKEFADTVDYYNEKHSGLGYEFAIEVRHTLKRITAFPEAWPIFSKRTRRCMINRFPYGVLYEIRSDHILVIAIMNLQCDPAKWEERA